jgi:hypothetical protein
MLYPGTFKFERVHGSPQMTTFSHYNTCGYILYERRDTCTMRKEELDERTCCVEGRRSIAHEFSSANAKRANIIRLHFTTRLLSNLSPLHLPRRYENRRFSRYKSLLRICSLPLFKRSGCSIKYVKKAAGAKGEILAHKVNTAD